MSGQRVDLSKYRTGGIERASMGAMDSARSNSSASGQTTALGRMSATPGMARSNLRRSSMSAEPAVTPSVKGAKDTREGDPPPSSSELLAKLERASTSLARVSQNPRNMQRTSMSLARGSGESGVSASEPRPADVERLSFELCIHDVAKDTPVSYKLDGGRFQVRETLKFLEGSEYQISLKVNPGLKIEGSVVNLDARAAENPRAPIVLRDALFLDKSGPGASSGIWTCTLAPSSKGERVLMSLEMQLEGFGKVVFPIMCKVYKPSASGAFHGQTCKMISYTVKKATDPSHAGHILRTQFI
mmetsp:Transcript_35333/g.89067  ORF Transcript_35333/g.89067 Transcript_35333/m.89067 type:complete len:301 (-) Transcript_35333:267-1169(-)|eukprot:jgi/Tetstr1/421545/TSEL_012492.t1